MSAYNAAYQREYIKRPDVRAKRTAYMRKWRLANMPRMNMHKRKQAYGITPEQFYERLKKQNHRCAICNRPFLTSRNTHVDHCHDTGKIRGLLCAGCNRGLGGFQDNKRSLVNAIGYLCA